MANQGGSAKIFCARGTQDGFNNIVAGSSQVITFQIGSSNVQSSAIGIAFGPATTIARFVTDVPCFISFGQSTNAIAPKVAGSSYYYLPPGVIDLMGVYAGSTVSVGTASSFLTGHLYITEGAPLGGN